MEVQRRQLLLFGMTALAGKLLTACHSATSAASSGVDPTKATSAANAIAKWATSGTASMTAKASYPSPFTTAGASPECAMTCELIQGPCYDATSDLRQDISDGRDGLPMRMQLRLLDESCKPIAGALVEVWHASPIGKYSGNDSAHENVAFCTENDRDFTSHKYFPRQANERCERRRHVRFLLSRLVSRPGNPRACDGHRERSCIFDDAALFRRRAQRRHLFDANALCVTREDRNDRRQRPHVPGDGSCELQIRNVEDVGRRTARLQDARHSIVSRRDGLLVRRTTSGWPAPAREPRPPRLPVRSRWAESHEMKP